MSTLCDGDMVSVGFLFCDSLFVAATGDGGDCGSKVGGGEDRDESSGDVIRSSIKKFFFLFIIIDFWNVQESIKTLFTLPAIFLLIINASTDVIKHYDFTLIYHTAGLCHGRVAFRQLTLFVKQGRNAGIFANWTASNFNKWRRHHLL